MSMGKARMRKGGLAVDPKNKRGHGGSAKKPKSPVTPPAAGSWVTRQAIPVGQRQPAPKRAAGSSLFIGGTASNRRREGGFDIDNDFNVLTGNTDQQIAGSPNLRSVTNKVSGVVPMPDKKGTVHPDGRPPMTVGRRRGPDPTPKSTLIPPSQLAPGEFSVYDPRGRIGVGLDPQKGGAKPSVGQNSYDDYEARVNRAQRRMGMGRKAIAKDINPQTKKPYTPQEIVAEERTTLEKGVNRRLVGSPDHKKATKKLFEHRMTNGTDLEKLNAEKEYMTYLTQKGTAAERTQAAETLKNFGEKRERYEEHRAAAAEAARLGAAHDKGPMEVINGQYFDEKAGQWKFAPNQKDSEAKMTEMEVAEAYTDFSRFFNTEDLDAFQMKALREGLSDPRTSYADLAERLRTPRMNTAEQMDEARNNLIEQQEKLRDMESKKLILGIGKGGHEQRTQEHREYVEQLREQYNEKYYMHHADLSKRDYFRGQESVDVKQFDTNQDGKVDDKDEEVTAAQHVSDNPDLYTPTMVIYANAVLSAVKAEMADAAKGRNAGK